MKMFVVDYCKGKLDFGRIEIEDDPNIDNDGLTPDLIAAMTASDLEREGYEVVVKEITK